MQLGTTFDIDQAFKFGLDWQKALKRLIELNLSPIRIGVKWNRVITHKNGQTWKDYDKIFDFLNSQNIPTVLQVGMKSPGWPEFYIPEYLNFLTPYMQSFKLDSGNEISQNDKVLVDNLFIFLEKAIKRYQNVSNIKWLQVENEPFLKYGPNKWRISKEFLEDEIAFARKLTNLPIILTAQGLPTTGIIAEYLRGRFNYKKLALHHSDTFGLNVFPKIRGKLLGRDKIFTASESTWTYLQKWRDKARDLNKELWITELQAEPWGPSKLDFKDAYSDTTCSPKLVKQYLEKLKQLGFETVLIWGSEFHLASEKQGNSSWIKEIYDSN